jgi:putative colanic acid biosynthesis UDP-glucose lipid carrier transferase
MISLKTEQLSLFVWLHRVMDLIIPSAVLLPLAISKHHQLPDHYIVAGLFASIALSGFAQLTGTYSNWRGRSALGGIKKVTYSWVLSWLAVLSMAFVLKLSASFSREVLLVWLVSTPALLISYRLLVRYILKVAHKHDIGIKNVLIIGAGELGHRLATGFQNSQWLGLKPVGFLDDDLRKQGESIANIPVLGDTKLLHECISRTDIHEVFICLPKNAEIQTIELINTLADSPLVVRYVPDIFSLNLMHAQFEVYNGIPTIGVFNTPLSSRTNRVIKRTEDIILSSLILLAISPVMLLIAAGVKLSSPGPIFFRQIRITEGNKPFEMLKFRSMPVDTDKTATVWGNASQKTNTKFGRFIRKTSLDELPQFLNVLKGDMSIVGPRPERDVFVEQFKNEIPRYMQKHMVKAGITGLAQVSGLRGDTCLKTRVEYDLRYISTWSLALDIKIILQTALRVFSDATAK